MLAANGSTAPLSLIWSGEVRRRTADGPDAAQVDGRHGLAINA
jgi:hypothetical protein